MITSKIARDTSSLLEEDIKRRVRILRKNKIPGVLLGQITGLHASQLSSFMCGSLSLSFERRINILTRLEFCGVNTDKEYDEEALKKALEQL